MWFRLAKNIFKLVCETCRNPPVDAPLWRLTTLYQSTARQNTVGDFISELRINTVLTGFFWYLSMLNQTLTTVETRNSSANCKIAREKKKKKTKTRLKLLLPWQSWATIIMLMLASYVWTSFYSSGALFWWFWVLVFRLSINLTQNWTGRLYSIQPWSIYLAPKGLCTPTGPRLSRLAARQNGGHVVSSAIEYWNYGSIWPVAMMSNFRWSHSISQVMQVRIPLCVVPSLHLPERS